MIKLKDEMTEFVPILEVLGQRKDGYRIKDQL
jgi:hypothetical protein